MTTNQTAAELGNRIIDALIDTHGWCLDVREDIEALVSMAEAAQRERDAALADAHRYRAFFDAGLPVTFLGQDYGSKADLDAAIEASMQPDSESSPCGTERALTGAKGWS